MRLDGEHRLAGPATGVGVDDACAGDRSPEQRCFFACLLTIKGVAERLGAVPGRLGRATTNAELKPAARKQVCCRRLLGHIERVLVTHVDDARSDLDTARSGADGREKREGRRQLLGKVVNAKVRAVGTKFLRRDRKFNRLLQDIARGPRGGLARCGPMTKR